MTFDSNKTKKNAFDRKSFFVTYFALLRAIRFGEFVRVDSELIVVIIMIVIKSKYNYYVLYL